MPARKKNIKPKKAAKKSAAKKPANKAVKKPASSKKTLSKAKKAIKPIAPSFVPPDVEEPVAGACTCIKRGTRWFCMKSDGNGHMIICDGPFTSKEDCEENAVCP